MTRLAIALRHVHFEDCGVLGEVLGERGFEIRYLEAGREALDIKELERADLLVGLGAPISVYDADRYPWIREELAFYQHSLRLRRPVIGICFGAQMLAAALGARVYAGPVKELGWTPLELTQEGRASVIAPLGATGISMLHWHGDTFDLPAGAKLLASTKAVRHQVFQWEERVLAFQCHPEIMPSDIESWLIGHAAEIASTPDTSLTRLREDTARFGPALRLQARQAFIRWLETMRL